MSFDADKLTEKEQFPCDCGGNITKVYGKFECDKCDFSKVPTVMTVDLNTGKTTDVRKANWIMLGQSEGRS